MSVAAVPVLLPAKGDPITVVVRVDVPAELTTRARGKRVRWGRKIDGRYELEIESCPGAVLAHVGPQDEGIRWMRGHYANESAECRALVAAFLLARSADAQ